MSTGYRGAILDVTSPKGIDSRLHVVLRRLPRILRSDRAPSAILQEIASASREVVGSDYGFAALLDDERALTSLGSSGLPPELDELLLDHPALRRVTAALLEEEGVVRVDAGSADVPDARGQYDAPDTAVGHDHAGHVTFGELLAVRLRSGVRTVGVIILANRPGSPGVDLEADDAMAELGRAMGAAIDNALLLREVLNARRWMRAATSLTQQLLGDELDDPLRAIAERAAELANADAATVSLLQGDTLTVHHVVGIMQGETLLDMSIPVDDDDDGMRALRAGDPLVYAELPESARELLPEEARHQLGAALVLPLSGADDLVGLLMLARHRDEPAFSHTELDMAAAFAAQASVALELEAARQLQERLLLVEERDRIARDLHDHVVQRLFATGLSLQQVVAQLDGPLKDRVSSGMVAIDETIRQIRNTILTLRSARDEAQTLTDMVTDIAAEAERLLGYPPILALDPAVRSVTGPVAEDLAACVREAMSNVVRHAHASQVIVKAAVHLGELTVSVADDGVGIRSDRRSGLENLDKRAENHGGAMTIDSEPDHGTTLTWVVPV